MPRTGYRTVPACRLQQHHIPGRPGMLFLVYPGRQRRSGHRIAPDRQELHCRSFHRFWSCTSLLDKTGWSINTLIPSGSKKKASRKYRVIPVSCLTVSTVQWSKKSLKSLRPGALSGNRSDSTRQQRHGYSRQNSPQRYLWHIAGPALLPAGSRETGFCWSPGCP